MSYKEKVNHYFTTADRYGTAVNFNYFKDTNTHKNLSGGLFSFFGLAILLFFSIFKSVSMFKGDNPTNTSSSTPSNPEKIIIPDLYQHFMIYVHVGWLYN